MQIMAGRNGRVFLTYCIWKKLNKDNLIECFLNKYDVSNLRPERPRSGVLYQNPTKTNTPRLFFAWRV